MWRAYILLLNVSLSCRLVLKGFSYIMKYAAAVSGFIVVCKMVEDYHKANAQIGVVYGSIQGMMIVLAE